MRSLFLSAADSFFCLAAACFFCFFDAVSFVPVFGVPPIKPAKSSKSSRLERRSAFIIGRVGAVSTLISPDRSLSPTFPLNLENDQTFPSCFRWPLSRYGGGLGKTSRIIGKRFAMLDRKS